LSHSASTQHHAFFMSPPPYWTMSYSRSGNCIFPKLHFC
jgi:hypothetical protein